MICHCPGTYRWLLCTCFNLFFAHIDKSNPWISACSGIQLLLILNSLPRPDFWQDRAEPCMKVNYTVYCIVKVVANIVVTRVKNTLPVYFFIWHPCLDIFYLGSPFCTWHYTLHSALDSRTCDARWLVMSLLKSFSFWFHVWRKSWTN